MTGRAKRILKRASAERDAELDEQEQQDRRRARAERPRTRGRHERFSVWWNLRGELHSVLAACAATGFFFGIPLSMDPETRALGLACIGSGALMVPPLAWSAFRLRSFRVRLPFALERWPALVDHELFELKEMWRHLAIELETAENADSAARDALLSRLCDRMQRTYYTCDRGAHDARISWRVTEGMARGSVNRDGVFQLVEWCLNEATPAAKALGLTRVVLTLANQPFSVSRPIDP